MPDGLLVWIQSGRVERRGGRHLLRRGGGGGEAAVGLGWYVFPCSLVGFREGLVWRKGCPAKWSMLAFLRGGLGRRVSP